MPRRQRPKTVGVIEIKFIQKPWARPKKVLARHSGKRLYEGFGLNVRDGANFFRLKLANVVQVHMISRELRLA